MVSTSQETAASTSNVSSIVRSEQSGYDQLPKEMHDMKIRDEKIDPHDDKVMSLSSTYSLYFLIFCNLYLSPMHMEINSFQLTVLVIFAQPRMQSLLL